MRRERSVLPVTVRSSHRRLFGHGHARIDAGICPRSRITQSSSGAEYVAAHIGFHYRLFADAPIITTPHFSITAAGAVRAPTIAEIALAIYVHHGLSKIVTFSPRLRHLAVFHGNTASRVAHHATSGDRRRSTELRQLLSRLPSTPYITYYHAFCSLFIRNH